MTSPSGLSAIGGVSYTMLLCRDIEVMRRFYEQVMGFELTRHIEGRYAEFDRGSSVLALRLRSRPYDGDPGPVEAASVQLAFRVSPDDVAIAADQLIELGVPLLEQVADLEDFGHRTLFFADPENNVIEIYAEI